MALSERVKQRARYHLEYTQLTTLTGLSLGTPVITQAKFLLDTNLINLDPIAEPDVIDTVERLDCNEKQRDQLAETMASGVAMTGGTKFDYEGPMYLLESRYRQYQNRLADQLATFVNPVSNTQNAQSGGVVEGDAY